MAGVRRVVAAIACVVALAACDATPTTTSPSPSAQVSPPPVAPLGGTAFPRTLQADRMVEVQIETPGDQRGIVVSVALDSPYFGPSGTVPTNVLLEPGWLARLRVPLGPPLCPAGSGSSIATVEVRAYEGTEVVEHEVELDDAALAEINASECRQRIATDAAAPSFASEPVVKGDSVETSVVLQRGASAATATLTALSGNIIFSLEPQAGGVPLTLDGDRQRAAVPVTLRAARCDAHAFAESKKTFVFTASFEVAGETITVEYQAQGAVREALQGLFDQCAARSDSDGIGGP
ncbi:MAG: hypothetical protein ACK4MD_04995 [Demequina sp.]